VRILVVIVNYRAAAHVAKCLDSLVDERRLLPGLGVVVVDNPAGGDDAARLQAHVRDRGFADWVEVRPMPRNGGFAYGVNAGVQPAMAGPDAPDAFLLLNPDTWIRPGAVAALADFLDRHPDVGVVGSRLEDPDGTRQAAQFRFPGVLNTFDDALAFGPVSRLLRRWATVPPFRDEAHPIDWLAGASMLVRRSVFERVGPFDDGFFLYFEELDFLRRARDLGIATWCEPKSRVVHLVGQSTGVTVRDRRPGRLPDYWFASRIRYFDRHLGRIGRFAVDVAYVAGKSLWHVLRVLRGRPDLGPPHALWDHARAMFRRR
jgi:GT2 family glycosyltransferase